MEDEDKGSLQDNKVDSYALLLPLLSSDANQQYALVTSNWQTWNVSGNVVQPYSMHNGSV